MTQVTNENRGRATRARVSLDAWAVAVALGLAALVWSGLIKHIPW